MTRAYESEGAGPSPCTVLYDAKSHRYRMWYVVWSKHRYDHRLPFSYNVAYAESADGLTWERPPLGVFDALAEVAPNNFIRLGKIKTQGVDVQLNSNLLTLLNANGEIVHQHGGLNGDISEAARALPVLAK